MILLFKRVHEVRDVVETYGLDLGFIKVTKNKEFLK